MKILPLENIPFCISASYEISNLEIKLFSGGGISYVKFNVVGYYNKIFTKNELKKFQSMYNKNIPFEIYNSIGIKLIELYFKNVEYFSIGYPNLEGKNKGIFYNNKYENGIPSYDLEKDKFNKIWNRTGNCPNPRIYIIKHSTIADSNNLKHYVVNGYDEELHIVSQDFSWKEA